MFMIVDVSSDGGTFLLIASFVSTPALGLSMVRLARCETLDPGVITVTHVFTRVVRRCFLLGDDPVFEVLSKVVFLSE